jgi:hypothetical protein
MSEKAIDYLKRIEENLWEGWNDIDTPTIHIQALAAIAQQLARVADALEEITRQPDLENGRQELLNTPR